MRFGIIFPILLGTSNIIALFQKYFVVSNIKTTFNVYKLSRLINESGLPSYCPSFYRNRFDLDQTYPV